MKVQNIDNIAKTKVTMEGAEGAEMQLLISEKDGAENFAMRLFTVERGGFTPFHFHNYEHEIYVLDGEGILKSEDGEKSFKSGDVIFIKPNEKHQFRNVGDAEMKFICLIPSLERCG